MDKSVKGGVFGDKEVYDYADVEYLDSASKFFI